MATVQHNFAASRFDLYDDGQRAGFLKYQMQQGRMCFLLTELAPRIRKRSEIGSILGAIFDDLHHRRMEVLPYCPVVRSFLATQPEYCRLVPSDRLRQFGLASGNRLITTTAG
ncbi:GNAT family N-acetyltransferase [Arthrobacter pigmenti]